MTKNFFNIHELIAKGTELVKEYELPVGKVFIRPLTDLELDECEAKVFETLKDSETIKFALECSAGEIAVDDIDFSKINIPEFITANTEVFYWIAFYAMRDFTEDLTLDLVKKLPGIKGLALEVKRLSGQSAEIIDQIEEFR